MIKHIVDTTNLLFFLFCFVFVFFFVFNLWQFTLNRISIFMVHSSAMDHNRFLLFTVVTAIQFNS